MINEREKQVSRLLIQISPYAMRAPGVSAHTVPMIQVSKQLKFWETSVLDKRTRVISAGRQPL